MPLRLARARLPLATLMSSVGVPVVPVTPSVTEPELRSPAPERTRVPPGSVAVPRVMVPVYGLFAPVIVQKPTFCLVTAPAPVTGPPQVAPNPLVSRVSEPSRPIVRAVVQPPLSRILPPLIVRNPAGSPSRASESNTVVPEPIRIPPVNVLVPPSTSVPVPCGLIPPAPLMLLLRFSTPVELLTLNWAWPELTTIGMLSVSVPAPE